MSTATESDFGTLIRHFSADEVRCKCGCGGLPQLEFMQLVDSLRDLCGFPFVVTSGFRCAAHNVGVSTTGANGPHTTGRAIDIQLHGTEALRVLIEVFTPFSFFNFSGIGLKQNGPVESRFIHLDNLTPRDGFPRPALWTY